MMLNTFFAATLLALAYGQCVFNENECQCMEGQSGKTCLRYLGGTAPNIQCEAYACGSGYICDCAGAEMCDVTDCSLTRSVYRPTNPNPISVGQIVDCELASEVKCVTPNGQPVPSNSPIPSASASATPSISLTPSSTPSATPSTTPSASSSPSASPSVSPTPSVTPSPPVIPLGGACTPSSTCEAGTSCSCLGVCATTISIEVEAIGDDSVSPWMCGNEFGPATTNYQQRGTWTYTGACSDLYFRVANSNGGHEGVTAAVREVGSSTWYPTALSAANGLTGIVENNPPNTDFFTDPAYDFSSWIDVTVSSALSGNTNYQSMNTDYGSVVWSRYNGHLGAGDLGVSYYKTTLPFC